MPDKAPIDTEGSCKDSCKRKALAKRGKRPQAETASSRSYSKYLARYKLLAYYYIFPELILED